MELAAGLHWYLKYWCGAHISWMKTGGAQLASVPKAGSLPQVQHAGVEIRRPVPWSYYQNAVTSSCKSPLSPTAYDLIFDILRFITYGLEIFGLG